MPYQVRRIGSPSRLAERRPAQLEAFLAGLLRLFIERDASQVRTRSS
jgi:hypothetical protein